MPTPPGQGVFQLRVTLDGVDPPVWRRLLVPAAVRVAKLHVILQVAMGWTNSHLHSFTIGGERYGMHFDDYPEDEIDENEVTVLRAIADHRRFTYPRSFTSLIEELVAERDRSPVRKAFLELRHTKSCQRKGT